MTAYKVSSVPVINQLISHMPDDWGIYIHIDKKSDIDSFNIDSRAHVCSIYKSYWGSKEHLDAMLAILKEAYDSPAGYDYFHYISGDDYWCCRPEDFDKVFTPPRIPIYSSISFQEKAGSEVAMSCSSISSYLHMGIFGRASWLG